MSCKKSYTEFLTNDYFLEACDKRYLELSRRLKKLIKRNTERTCFYDKKNRCVLLFKQMVD